MEKKAITNDAAAHKNSQKLDDGQIRQILKNFISANHIGNAAAILKSLANLKFVLDNDSLAISLPHQLFADYYAKYLKTGAETLFRRCFGAHIKINYARPSINNVNDQPVVLNDPEPPDPFAGFISSEKNRGAIAAARALAEDDSPRLLILSGPAGSGKSRLLTAMRQAIARRRGAKVCVCCRAESFSPPFPPEEFWNEARALLLDDGHDLPARPDLQELLARHLDCAFQSPYFARIALVFPAADFRSLALRLARKLERGLAVELCAADLPMRTQYAAQKCRELNIPGQYALPVARHSQQISQIDGLLQKLALYGKITGQFPSMQQMEKLALPADRLPDWQLIIQRVAERMGVKPGDILGRSRLKKIVQARQMAMHLCRARLGLSYPEIGRLFGGKDHSTVMHSIDKIQQLRQTDAFAHNLLTELEQAGD